MNDTPGNTLARKSEKSVKIGKKRPSNRPLIQWGEALGSSRRDHRHVSSEQGQTEDSLHQCTCKDDGGIDAAKAPPSLVARATVLSSQANPGLSFEGFGPLVPHRSATQSSTSPKFRSRTSLSKHTPKHRSQIRPGTSLRRSLP